VLKTFRESLSLLGTRRFGTFWFASLLSSIGTWAQQVAEPWLLLTLGASSFVIGLDSFAMNAPVWFLTLVGGALADRTDRRRVITLFQSIQMLCPIAIIVLMVARLVSPWMIIAISVIVGVTDALSMPSFQSIVPSIVEHERIGTGLALNSTQFNVSRVLGPSLAGVLMVSFGAMSCFVVSAVSYLPFIGVALWILPRWTPTPAATAAIGDRHLFSGTGQVLRQRHLLGSLLTVLVTSVLCAPLVTFTPVLVKEVFHADAGHFSTAVASFGIGGILGAFVLLADPPKRNARRLSTIFALTYGFVLVLVGLNRWFVAIPPLLVLAGASMTVSNTSANSFLQANADPRVLGRTVSLYMLAMRGGLSVGALLTGLSADLMGVRHTLIVNGSLAIVAQLAVGRLWSQSGRQASAAAPGAT
jgi:predicted MFS family arabinose efflux permease